MAEFEACGTIEQLSDHLTGGNMIVEHAINRVANRHIHTQTQRQLVRLTHGIHAFGDMT